MNTKHWVSSAMAAYGPLAFKTFGSELLTTADRLAFLRSLVLSRFLFAVRTLRHPVWGSAGKHRGAYSAAPCLGLSADHLVF